mmetsp:Transcript_6753/g.9660  ORF Transcript_6753/g.9660 Transcript_6753/m.9660 type:complete len:318 (-) Transcript_6753:242-1195(-)
MSSYEPDITMLFMLGGGVLFVWGFVRSVYLCFRKLLYGEERGRASDDEPGEIYRIMSSARQEEIVDLRKNALLRYLSRFTLTLGEEHLLCCTGSHTDTALSLSENEEVNDGCVTTNETCKGTEKNDDIEKGNKDDVQDIGIGDMAQDSTKAADKYTHISIPLPGCDIEGIHICSCSMEAEKEDRQEVKRRKLPSLFQTRDDDAREKQEPITITSDPNHHQQQQKVEKRSVPIFCAICLSEYETCDRVCWSSNTDCSHVFHEDCILQWLISSGKKRSMNEFFTRHPTDEKLLEHEFCPCCRQDFICVRPALLGSEESV